MIGERARASSRQAIAAQPFGWAAAALCAAFVVPACGTDPPTSDAAPVAAVSCGDGVIDPGEECDDGPARGSTPCGCQQDCQFAPTGKSCSDGDACNGPETCNGAGACISSGPPTCDDRMLGTVDTCASDHGCVHLGFAPAPSTEIRGLVSDAQPFHDVCPPGQLMVGLDAVVELKSLVSLAVVCGSVNIDGELAVTIGFGLELPQRGWITDAGRQQRSCPANEVVVGFGGAVGESSFDQLSLRCAPLTISRDVAGTLAVTVGTVTAVAPVTVAEPQSTFSDTACGPGTVAAGAILRSAGLMDSFGLFCRKPSVTVD